MRYGGTLTTLAAVLPVLTLLQVESAQACSYYIPYYVDVPEDLTAIVGTVVGYKARRFVSPGEWKGSSTGLVVEVDESVLNPLGENRYEVHPFGHDIGCERVAFAAESIKQLFPVGSRVWVLAHQVSDLRYLSPAIYPLLDGYPLDGGQVMPFTEEIAALPEREFDFALHRQLVEDAYGSPGVSTRQQDIARHSLAEFKRFAYLRTIVTLRDSEDGPTRLEILRNLQPLMVTHAETYHALVDRYAPSEQARKDLRDELQFTERQRRYGRVEELSSKERIELVGFDDEGLRIGTELISLPVGVDKLEAVLGPWSSHEVEFGDTPMATDVYEWHQHGLAGLAEPGSGVVDVVELRLQRSVWWPGSSLTFSGTIHVEGHEISTFDLEEIRRTFSSREELDAIGFYQHPALGTIKMMGPYFVRIHEGLNGWSAVDFRPVADTWMERAIQR